jgi:ABC-type branched-subunit amino acid transport system ATPase component
MRVIEKVQFRNFKAYRTLDLELEPFTVLVGPNASGKTTLLEGLRLVSQLAGEWLGKPGSVDGTAVKASSVPALPSELRSYGTREPIEWNVWGVWSEKRGAARVVAGASAQTDESRGLPVSVTGEWGDRVIPGSRPRGSPKLVGMRPLEPGRPEGSGRIFRDALASTAILRFEARKLTEASYSEDPVPAVLTDGTGLSSVLAYLKLSQDEVFNEIELALKQVVPSVRRIRIERASVEQTTLRTLALDEQKHQVPEKRHLWGHQVVFDMQGAKGVPASAAGEGTLMALGLLTVLMGPAKPRLVLLDDIELALHPTAQAKLIEVLRAIQKRDPELQIIATSHSPFILNYLDPKEVRMTFLAENGFARCEKLTAHPEFEKWKDLMSPGEFWSTVGESWLEKVGEPAAHE